MKLTLNAAAALLLAGGGLLVAQERSQQKQPPGKAEKVAATPLEGRYTVAAGEKDGKEIPAERIKGSVVVFTGDRIVGTDKDRKEFFAATFALDTNHKPWLIKMKSTSPKEADATGLVKKEGDAVTIVYALPGGDAPTDFKTKEKQHMFVLKPMKDEGAKEPPKVIKD
ncbi:MAG TPA: TIGR03067 domain-containing protein [Gemmata sp.]|nr:TIGR03067 domain-containing protein [Gemmata sp.]